MEWLLKFNLPEVLIDIDFRVTFAVKLNGQFMKRPGTIPNGSSSIQRLAVVIVTVLS